MLPFFYAKELIRGLSNFILDEPTSKHVVQVLRKKENETLLLTDGKGLKVNATILEASKKHCLVNIDNEEFIPQRPCQLTLAIAFTKFAARNEWLLEKVTELGIERIVPLVTDHSENEKFKEERLMHILISAMLQSQQVYLPILEQPMAFDKYINLAVLKENHWFIAHCETGKARTSYIDSLEKGKNSTVLIGPEGDFSAIEIEKALSKGAKPVTFGENRLRTETAGIYACTVFNALNYE